MKVREIIGRFGVLVASAVASAGCGGATDRLPREPISGTVTFEGEPLRGGSIQFLPAGTKEGIASGGVIADGQFRVARQDGPVPGQYTVMIFASGESAAAKGKDGDLPGRPAPKTKKGAPGLIPARYNLKTELTAKVEGGADNTFRFDLKR